MIRYFYILILFLNLLLIKTSLACLPAPNWIPPTTQTAFANSKTVIHAQVISQETKNYPHVIAKIRVLKVLKGDFSSDTVRTTDGASCGVGQFKIDKEYIFFFKEQNDSFVDDLRQPRNQTTQDILKEIEMILK